MSVVEKTPEYTTEHHEGVAEKSANDETMAWVSMVDDAKKATEAEHKMSLYQALKIYHKAAFWSMAVTLGIIMDGYDTALVSSLFAQPAFQRKYGKSFNGSYQIEAQWQIALGLSATIGNIVGIFLNSTFTERYGHKKVLLVSYVANIAFIFLTFFAPNVQVLFVGEVLCGLPWGVFTTMAPAYASEVCPVVLRGYLATFVVMC